MNTNTHIRHIYSLNIKSNGILVDFITVGDTPMFGVALDMPKNGEYLLHNRKKLAVTGRVITRTPIVDDNWSDVVTDIKVSCEIFTADPANLELTVTFDNLPDVTATGKLALGDDY